MPDSVNASPLTIDVDDSGDLVRLRLHGKLTMGVSNQLHIRVKKLIPGHKRIVLDLSDLSHMDSSAGHTGRVVCLGAVGGCSLELINLSHGIQKVLSLTNLLSVFAVVGESGLKIG